ncbi:GNAT family N-acetyltransferase [Vagococcus carniphilus]|uniref:GNAT family N-acetyltransferase n=1 Tax=Vagococcus carniphilus TaxID=218144 RepID=UPI00288E0F62|nr:GNAT family N-acetyltransferase [Vagococcus carniphilus]MDT2830600.1 GNAT family N-acetyltransferase [Vagococcus carniphilus]MDT2839899.1 GNAT family N-acetyltransferase [Vagococcus carniphilus]MDT2854655.1 GNAT family N-acetyltransferase [Vagococcus carniphilus]
MISLQPVTEENLDDIISLDVSLDQKEFMQATNIRCIADVYVLNAEGMPAIPLGIYDDNQLVGFLMYTYDILDHESFEGKEIYQQKSYFIWHIMIDQQHQGKGLGKLAFHKIIEEIKTLPLGDSSYIALFYHQDNLTAKSLYTSFNFLETGIIQDESVMMIKSIGKKND